MNVPRPIMNDWLREHWKVLSLVGLLIVLTWNASSRVQAAETRVTHCERRVTALEENYEAFMKVLQEVRTDTKVSRELLERHMDADHGG